MLSSKGMGFLTKYHTAVNNGFAAYGSFVARRPFAPLIIGVLLLGSLCIGLHRVEQESDVEELWVERRSRVIKETDFFNSHFGGLPRKEAATINLKSSLDDKFPNLAHAMDALLTAIKPLYDNLTWNVTVGDKVTELDQRDFCERPQAPAGIRSGVDPFKNGNWHAWGYRMVAQCALQTVGAFYPGCCTNVSLPKDWGIDTFPCFKLTPLDCFKEGREFDYPESLVLLEQEVTISGARYALKDFVYGFESNVNYTCLKTVDETLKSQLYQSQGVTPTLAAEIVEGIKNFMRILPSWGYNWRPSYRNMTDAQILDHFRGAIAIAKNSSSDPTDPGILHCILEKQPCCMGWFGGHIPIEAAFGSVTYDLSGQISEIGALRWGANHWHHNHPLWIEYMANKLNVSYAERQRKDLVLQWEERLKDHLISIRENKVGTTFGDGEKNADFQLQFNVWRSSEDLLADANKAPIWQLGLSIALVVSYALLAFVDFRRPVHSHTFLVLMGMMVVSLAVVSGFGLTSALGIKLTPLAGSVVPFLALGLGIDDVFVLVNILRNFLEDERIKAMDTSKSTIPDLEMRLTVSLAGPSVVLTTFSVLASFFISSVNPMPIVRWFCWQMGITASIHTLGMLLIFIPIMSIDARRVKKGVVDPILWPLCGIRRKKVSEPIVKTSLQQEEFMINESELKEHSASTAISRAVAKYYAPLFTSNLFKGIVVAVFATFLAVMTYLAFWKVEEGLRLSDVTLKGSYQHDFAVLTEERFSDYDIWIVTQNIPDYSERQGEIWSMYGAVQNLSYWLHPKPSVFEASWLGNVYASLNSSLDRSKGTLTLPSDIFNREVQKWAISPSGILSLHDLYCENKVTKEPLSCFADHSNPNWSIGATKTVVPARNLGPDPESNLNMMRAARKTMDSVNDKYFNGSKNVYVSGYPFLLYEQYLHSQEDLYTVVGLALVGVFVAVLIFQFSITVSLIIALVLLMVDIEVYGFLYVMGAKLNSFSLVNLGIVIGMASEFTYLARSFLVVDGTRNHRVGKALEWTFEPLLHGFGTQVVATFPVVFLKYPAFRVYYFEMFTVMGVLGFLNGFVLLPVLLSWVGPAPLPHIRKRCTPSIETDSSPERNTLPLKNGNSSTSNQKITEEALHAEMTNESEYTR